MELMIYVVTGVNVYDICWFWSNQGYFCSSGPDGVAGVGVVGVGSNYYVIDVILVFGVCGVIVCFIGVIFVMLELLGVLEWLT